MGDNTDISWADKSWSPWYGCTQVSMGEHGACVGCYALHLSETRMGRVVFGGPGRGEGTRDARADSAWKDPIRWNRTAPGSSVFPSMCDPFDNHPDLPPLRARFFDLIRETPNLTWLLLTKRPGNIVRLFADTIPGFSLSGGGEYVARVCREAWPRNAAIGCTVVTQEEADRDVPRLLSAKGILNPAFAFVSMEPLLGPVDLTYLAQGGVDGVYDALRGDSWITGSQEFDPVMPNHRYGDGTRGARRYLKSRRLGGQRLDWIIAGGETDQGAHKARPSHPDWFRSLRDQCTEARVPFHFKQWGEHAPAKAAGIVEHGPTFAGNGTVKDWMQQRVRFADGTGRLVQAHTFTGHATIDAMVFRVGKKAAGRALDGVIHDARPAVRRAA